MGSASWQGTGGHSPVVTWQEIGITIPAIYKELSALNHHVNLEKYTSPVKPLDGTIAPDDILIEAS